MPNSNTHRHLPDRIIEGIVERDRPVTTLYSFEAWAALDTALPLLAAPALQRGYGLDLPPDRNPRTAALGRSWRAAISDDPITLEQRAMTHIRRENFGYSLSPPPLVGVHRMDEFLFETRLGFCEHYAAAFVLLMRSAGVPARVVTGYLGGAYNRIGGYWIVRNSDAHAWAEILVEGRGWIRADPTAAIAPERVDQSGSAFAGQTLGDDIEWLRSLRERADAAVPGGTTPSCVSTVCASRRSSPIWASIPVTGGTSRRGWVAVWH